VSNRLRFGNVTLTAIAVTPMRLKRKSDTEPTLAIPFSGDLATTVDGKQHAAHAGHTGLFSSGKPKQGLMNNQSSYMLITLNPANLLEIAQAMLGPGNECSADALRLSEDRALSLKAGNTSFDTLFRNHWRTVDGLFHNPKALAMLGMDDVLKRSVVSLLAPELFLEQSRQAPGSSSKENRVLDRVCAYIEAHSERPITATELEQISGLSGRSLQYAFRRRFDCSPMDWVRQHRLELARSSLRSGVKVTTVTQVALEFGFNNLSLFARYYRERFGESPSVTLQRAISRR
jgi:AraC-like DNA-binding protein